MTNAFSGYYIILLTVGFISACISVYYLIKEFLKDREIKKEVMNIVETRPLSYNYSKEELDTYIVKNFGWIPIKYLDFLNKCIKNKQLKNN